MSLGKYRQRRDFAKSPEPSGRAVRTRRSGRGLAFAIQKHAASRLHYDLRLEHDGVLKSWAVPKGPSLDTSHKRLAVQVEDHPLDYGGFEGTIPQGEYGGGTVLLWDRGEWTPQGDPAQGLRVGKLKFELAGAKLKGGWMLVRGGGGVGKDQENWLLIKERDEHASTIDVLSDKPLSVTTGRDLDEIAAGKKPRERARRIAKPRSARNKPIKGDKLPKRVRPQLATLASQPPAGDDWFNEIKFDGYRMICRIESGKVRFISRNGLDWTNRFADLSKSAAKLPVSQAVLDGEVVALEPDGRSSFQRLQNSFRNGKRVPLVFFVFDLLHVDGEDLSRQTLETRKQRLDGLIPRHGSIRFTEHIEGNAAEFFEQACRMGLEGIIAKRRDRPYRPGRSREWLKLKCVKHEEFVIGGYTDPEGSREGFGALLLGHIDASGGLKYAGKVGTGFPDGLLHELHARLTKLERSRSPFENLSHRHAEGRGAHWVKPELIAQVKFAEWTDDGLLRQASFQGLREGKAARDVQAGGRRREAGGERPEAGGGTPKAEGIVGPMVAKRGVVRSGDATTVAGARLTSPDKVLYPEAGITKRDLAEFYVEIADWILPHLVGRPLAIVRCPEGRGGTCFFQKHPVAGTPDALKRITIAEKAGNDQYVVVEDLQGLISLVQIGALEIHTWGSRADNVESPDRLVFDLDPDPSVGWDRVVAGARLVRDLLANLGLASFVKTTGGKGLHVVVPIARRNEWDEVKNFCQGVAKKIVEIAPTQYTATLAKAARKGKIFIDYLRNGRGATAIVAYSTRAREGAPLSMPISWKELESGIRSDEFTLPKARSRLARLKRDPWAEIGTIRQALTSRLLKQF